MAAKLWEDTVVTALRDAQWMNCKGRALPQTFPPGFVKLDGNAESALGDLLYSSGERYYLIEVKSERNKITSEWTGSDGTYKEKIVYSSLRERWNKLEEVSSMGEGEQQEEFDFFMKSVSCHHISYWNEWKSGQITTGEAVLEPYMAACLDVSNSSGLDKGKAMQQWNENDFLIGSEINGTFLGAKAISVSKIFYENSRVFAVRQVDGRFQAHGLGQLGLPLNEFQDYINALIESAGGEALELHAIVLSNTGATFKVVSTTEDLRSVFYPAVEPEKSPEQKSKILTLAPPPGIDSSAEKKFKAAYDKWKSNHM